MNTITTVKGNALAMAAVCNASSPPATSSTAATIPAETAQKTRCHTGGFSAAPVVMISITNAPESADVTKNVMTSNVASPEATAEKGKCSSVSNSATGMLLTAVAAMLEVPLNSLSSGGRRVGKEGVSQVRLRVSPDS